MEKRIFAEVLREARIDLGLTIYHVAAEIGVLAGSYSKFESGRVTPSLENAVKLAEFLGIELRDLEFKRVKRSKSDFRLGKVHKIGKNRNKPHLTLFAKTVTAKRNAQRTKVSFIAAKVGVTPGAVTSWENGISRPNRKNLADLLDTLGLEPGLVDRLRRNKIGVMAALSLVGQKPVASTSKSDTLS